MTQTRYRTDNTHMLPMLSAICKMGSGTGFTILMEYPGHHGQNKDYAIYPRFGQPCQGGDMRRYKSVHGGKATQPHNERPGDLSQPFPEGKPSAIAFHNLVSKSKSGLKIVDTVLSDTSPWKFGFGSRGNVEMIEHNGKTWGFMIKNLDVDPTVLVNMLGFINSIPGHDIDPYLNEGLSPNEALGVMMLNGFNTEVVVATNSYRFPIVFSARRFFEQRPNDLSGGFYSAGADYNRTYVQDVFAGDRNKGGVVWQSGMAKILGKTSGFSFKDFCKAAKQFFEESLSNEPELTDDDTRYIYRDATGAVLPYPAQALKINPSLKKTKEEEKAA